MQDNRLLNFRDYIRIIGRGQRAGRTLTQTESYNAMSMLISGQVTPEQRGAFLMLLRVREETSEELAGFVQALREHNSSGLDGLNVDLDMGCYAGKRRHLPWFLLAILALSQTGKRIFLHGTNEPDSNRLYLNSVLPQLGFATARTVDEARILIERFGFTYMELSNVNTELNDIIQLRSQFGLRSCANTLARILNPSSAKFSLQGVFHRHVDEKHRHTAALLNDRNVLCFRGEGGEVEYNPERPMTIHTSRAGVQACQDVPALTNIMTLKSKSLDCLKLIKMWTGEEQNEYGHNSVIGTLATMLVLIDSLDWSSAIDSATHIWQSRNIQWPAVVSHLNWDDHDFETAGKYYAH